MIEGTFEGTISGAKWTEWADEKTGQVVPVLTVPVNVTAAVDGANKVVTLSPSLFFDNSIIDRGNDQGKTRMQVSIETLGSMGLEVDSSNFANNSPATWDVELEGKDASVYAMIKQDKDGNERQRAYLNRRSKPKISDQRVNELWGSMSGGAMPQDTRKPAAAAAPTEGGLFGPDDDDDNLPF